jgi:alpha-tubulin suppressor-like RCC1 family protein
VRSVAGIAVLATAIAGCDARLTIGAGIDQTGGSAGAAATGGTGNSGGGGGTAGDGGAAASGGTAGTGGASGSGGSAGDGGTSACVEPFVADAISIGGRHGCLLERGTGLVWCWGEGTAGQLGHGQSRNEPFPVRVRSSSRYESVQVLAVATCALRDDARLDCWGNNFDGVLADGGSQSWNEPVETASDVARFSAGSGAVMASTTTNQLLAWGRNSSGQFGLGAPTVGEALREETLVSGVTAQLVALGPDHACITDTMGQTACAGANVYSALGTGGASRSVFSKIDANLRFRALSVNRDRSCGIDVDGALRCWGLNRPVFVDGAPDALRDPELVHATARDFTALSVGADHLCALRAGGALWCVGDNAEGERGESPGPVSRLLTEVTPDTRYSALSAGDHVTCAIRAVDGAPICFGKNDVGQLGRGAGAGPEPGEICKRR